MDAKVVKSQSLGGANREKYLDYLRFMATFAVIVEHVVAEGYRMHSISSSGWYIAVIADSLVRWCVPIFVMISGALFLKPEKEITINLIIKKYVKRLLIAYCFWYIAYVCMYIIIESAKAGTLILQADFFKPQFHLWFLPMLMAVYLLMPILRIVASSEKILKYSLVLWFTYITLSFCIGWDIPQFSKLFVMNIVIGYSGYYLLGYYLASKVFTRRHMFCIIFLGIIGIIVKAIGNIILSINNGEADNSFLFELGPHIVLTAAAVFVTIKYYENKISNRYVMKVIESTRKDLFGIYLIHGVWLYLFIRYYDMSSPILTIPLISIIIFAFSFISSKLMRRGRLLKTVVE